MLPPEVHSVASQGNCTDLDQPNPIGAAGRIASVGYCADGGRNNKKSGL